MCRVECRGSVEWRGVNEVAKSQVQRAIVATNRGIMGIIVD